MRRGVGVSYPDISLDFLKSRGGWDKEINQRGSQLKKGSPHFSREKPGPAQAIIQALGGASASCRFTFMAHAPRLGATLASGGPEWYTQQIQGHHGTSRGSLAWSDHSKQRPSHLCRERGRV